MIYSRSQSAVDFLDFLDLQVSLYYIEPPSSSTNRLQKSKRPNLSWCVAWSWEAGEGWCCLIVGYGGGFVMQWVLRGMGRHYHGSTNVLTDKFLDVILGETGSQCRRQCREWRTSGSYFGYIGASVGSYWPSQRGMHCINQALRR